MKVALVLALLGWTHAAAAQSPEPPKAAPVPADATPPAAATDADRAWTAALDALVAGDLDAALSAAARVEADPAASLERRAEARGLVERIHQRKSGSAVSRPGPARMAPPAAVDDGARSEESGANDERGGRAFLVGTTTLAGLALWGWSVPTALDITNQRGQIGLYMLTAGASFGVPFLLTRQGPVTWGMANMTWTGATRGALTGFAVGALIAGDSSTAQGQAASALLGSMMGTLGGALFARETALTPGNANLIGLGADVGALLGLGVAHMSGLDQLSEDSSTRDRDLGVRMMASFALGGGAAGILGGRLLGARGSFTWGDAEAMRLPIAIGVTGAAMVMRWADAESTRGVVGALTVGGLGGAVLGAHLVREKDFGVGQGFLLDLGTVAGALTAMGGVYLISGSDNDKTYLTSAFVGAAAAFSTLYATLEAPAVRRLSARLTPSGKGTPRIALTPYLGAASTRGLALGGTF